MIAVLAPLALVISCGTANASPPSTAVWAPAHCAARGRLPDPACTPGATNPEVTQATIDSTICVRGWTRTVRAPKSATARIKTERMAAYGVPESRRSTVELDHLIPLELGGGNTEANLWPEVSDIPGAGFRNHKDAVERRLNEQVCAGRITLVDAQRAIATDWTTAEARLAPR